MSLAEEVVLNTVEVNVTKDLEVDSEVCLVPMDNPAVTQKTIQPNQAKLVKRTAFVCKNINDFMEKFFDNTELLDELNSEDNQQKLRLLTNINKVKCKKDEYTEEDIKRKAERKAERKEIKKLEKQVKKTETQINKLKGRPKSAYYYYAIDEKIKVLIEHPEWNNKDSNKEIHLELQRRWKEARLTDKLKFYQDKADFEYENMPIPVHNKSYKSIDRNTKHGDDPRINKYNKNKIKFIDKKENTNVISQIVTQKTPGEINPLAKEFIPRIYQGGSRFIDYRKITQ